MMARDPQASERVRVLARRCSLLLLLALGGCPSGPVPRERGEGEGAAHPSAPAASAEGAGAGGLPSGHPPLAEGAPSAGAPAAPADGVAPEATSVAGDPGLVAAPPLAGITWDAPPRLVQLTPSNGMRAAEYTSRNGQVSLVVFFFPEMRETVRANVERWKAQFDEAARAAARVETRGVAGLSVTTLDIEGENAGMHTGPAAAGAPRPHQRMLAATVVAPEGFVFFKMVGAAAAVAQERASFDALLASLRPVTAQDTEQDTRTQPGSAHPAPREPVPAHLGEDD